MKRRFYTKDFAELISETDIPASYHVQGHIQEEETDFNFLLLDKEVSGYIGSIRLNGVAITYSNLHQQTDIEIALEQQGPHLELHFELEGQKQFTSKAPGGMDITITEGRHGLFFAPDMKGQLEFIRGSTQKKEIGIEFSLERFSTFFDNDLEILGDFGLKLLHGAPALLSEKSYTTPIMQSLLHDILNCEFSGVLKKMYIESRVIELMTLVIEQVHTAGPASYTLPQADVDKVYRAREIILERLDEPCSLLQLARMSGLNDFKLKKGFREIFGTTVFGFLFDERMKLGRHLLQNGKHSIADIAFMVGYKNPTHFTVAFKRKFGYLPSDVRKQ